MNAQWSTATPIPMDSELLLMQYECRVVYFGEWDVNGDYCDMCHDIQDYQWTT